MIVELVSVGTEILLGNIVNTNAAYLAQKCALLGFTVYNQTVVGDNEGRLDYTIGEALKRSDIVIMTGGLGPTEDDLTKETAAKHMGYKLVEDMHTRKRIEDFFKGGIYKEIPENNWKQAVVPEGALVIDNHNGMAPGLIMDRNSKVLIMLPGPPNELYPMFENDIFPYLEKLNSEVIHSEVIKITGTGESQVENAIIDLIDSQTNPTIATYAKTSEVHVRVTAKGENVEYCREIAMPVCEEIKKRFGNKVFSTDEKETLEECVIKLLKEKNYKVTAAESCTGGMIASMLVNVSGASEVMKESVVTYSEEAKIKYAGVNPDTINTYGVVSEETAYEMAYGIADKCKTEASMAVTGIAGPDGGTEEKPVGLVYVAACVKGKVNVSKFIFKGNREKIRVQAAYKAMDMLRIMLLEE